MKKGILKAYGLLLLLLITIFSDAQTVSSITPQVIASGGGSSLPLLSGDTYDFTIGEVMVQTFSLTGSGPRVNALTQGFQQPSSEDNILKVNKSVSNTCIGASNGTASLIVVSSTGPVHYHWDSPLNTNTQSVSELSPGVYHYEVTDGHFSITDSVIISEDQVDCGSQLVFFHVVTPNGDGHNDTWVIDGIDAFKENSVEIYNRWGDLVWNRDNYDNASVVWDGKAKSGKQLPDATYFYIIKAGGKTYKGWIELIH